ncbi:MAG: transporter substrate-binding domain-containing protein [Thalassospira sp.]|uniref:substrate-binding periplasmic protein n=1 Tax=Thalassospira sp. TaxID=1912094 RepID=UPI0032EC9999
MARPTFSKCAAGMCFAVLISGGLIAALAPTARAESPVIQLTENTTANTGCRAMSVGGASGWEPISYIDPEGRQGGVAIDILKQYSMDHGIRLDLLLDIPWSRSIQMLEKGELDVIAGAYFTAERDRIYTYSTPYISDDVMVFQHRENQFEVTGMHDLIGYRGARPQGGSYGDYIDKYAEHRLDMMFSPTGDRIFNVLLSGRADYVMLGRYDGMANISRDKLANEIKPVEPPIVRNEVRFLFSRNSPCARHVENINILIETLDEDGTLQRWTESHLSASADSGS